MSISNISNSDAWSRFMETTQAARIRNNGLSKLETRPEMAAVKAVLKSSSEPGISKTGNVRNAAPELYSQRKPEKSPLILGNHFDAYA